MSLNESFLVSVKERIPSTLLQPDPVTPLPSFGFQSSRSGTPARPGHTARYPITKDFFSRCSEEVAGISDASSILVMHRNIRASAGILLLGTGQLSGRNFIFILISLTDYCLYCLEFKKYTRSSKNMSLLECALVCVSNVFMIFWNTVAKNNLGLIQLGLNKNPVVVHHYCCILVQLKT